MERPDPQPPSRPVTEHQLDLCKKCCVYIDVSAEDQQKDLKSS